MTAMEEQETTVVTQIRNGDPLIYTANPVHIRALDKRVAEGRATVRRTWTVEDRVEAREYSIPAGTFDPLKGFQADSQARETASRIAEHRVQLLKEPFRSVAKLGFVEGYMARYHEVNG